METQQQPRCGFSRCFSCRVGLSVSARALAFTRRCKLQRVDVCSGGKRTSRQALQHPRFRQTKTRCRCQSSRRSQSNHRATDKGIQMEPVSLTGVKTSAGANVSKYNINFTAPRYVTLYDIDVPADGSAGLRIIISIVYSLVCALGLVGNFLVIFLMRSKQRWQKSAINTLVFGLAVTDFQFVLTLPFWAVEVALDMTWPFGLVMCKLILSLTVMNMYASVFFLTVICITRYWSIASALKARRRPAACTAMWLNLVIWLAAGLATLPHAIYSTTAVVSSEELCLVRFHGPVSSAQFWLGLYHLQKIVLGFALPLLTISVCYLLLLRYLKVHTLNNNNPKKRSRVTKSVTVIVLSFFICWLPNQAITLWGVLVKFNRVPFSSAFYAAQTYVFPASVCLAHTNSCLNPIIYCLMRTEFREVLNEMFWRISPAALTRNCQIGPFLHTGARTRERCEARVANDIVAIPLQPLDSSEQARNRGSNLCHRRDDTLPSTTAVQRLC
ncbi:unnamed protein product [Lampetra fluviatilis]